MHIVLFVMMWMGGVAFLALLFFPMLKRIKKEVRLCSLRSIR